MAYTTLTKLQIYMDSGIIQQLTDDNETGSIDTGVVTEFIDIKQKLIDSFLKGRYPSDMDDADVPEFISDICTKLVAYGLYNRRLTLTRPESITSDYKDAIKILENIQKGKITPFEEENEPGIILNNKTTTSTRKYTTARMAKYY